MLLVCCPMIHADIKRTLPGFRQLRVGDGRETETMMMKGERMMKKYEEPKMEVVEVEDVDVLCASNTKKGGLPFGSYNANYKIFCASDARVH